MNCTVCDLPTPSNRKTCSAACLSRHVARAHRARNKLKGTRRERSASQKRRYRKRFPERDKAHSLVYAAIVKGVLVRQPCEICGEPKSEAHHDDYSKPLEVRWLCKPHHLEADIACGWGIRPPRVVSWEEANAAHLSVLGAMGTLDD